MSCFSEYIPIMDFPPSIQNMFCARPQKADAIITQDLIEKKNFRGLSFFAENRSADSCIYTRRREDFWVAGIKCSYGGA
jgi:hypothetical protein